MEPAFAFQLETHQPRRASSSCRTTTSHRTAKASPRLSLPSLTPHHHHTTTSRDVKARPKCASKASLSPLSSPPGIIYFAGHQSKGEPTVANIKIPLHCNVQRGLEGVRPALLTNLHFRISPFSSRDFLPPLLRSFFVAGIESCPHSRRFVSSEEGLNWLA